MAWRRGEWLEFYTTGDKFPISASFSFLPLVKISPCSAGFK